MTITEQNYVDKAEKVILTLREQKDNRGKTVPQITTTKIRNLLAMTADIYNEVLNHTQEKLSEEIAGRIDYLKIRFVYEAGREQAVKYFVEQAQILQAIGEIQGSRKRFMLFNKYMEALVAYHRFHGGKDQ